MAEGQRGDAGNQMLPASLRVTGRELDALVAERVLGFDPYSNDPRGVYHHPTEMACADAGNCRDEKGTDAAPHYSTDIFSSWKVVTHLQSQGKSFALWRHSGEWTAIFADPQPYFLEHYESGPASTDTRSGETAPLATCWAALQAVGWDKGDSA